MGTDRVDFLQRLDVPHLHNVHKMYIEIVHVCS